MELIIQAGAAQWLFAGLKMGLNFEPGPGILATCRAIRPSVGE